MSRALSGGARPVLAALLLAVAGPARGDDLLDQVRRANEIRAQKMEADVREAQRDADRLARTDPAKAAAILRGALANLEDDTALSKSRRETLARALRDRVRQLEADADRLARTDRTDPGVRKTDPRAEEEAVQRQLDAIQALRKAGRSAEADRLTGELARTYPDSPAAKAAARINSVNDRLADARRQNDERDNRRLTIDRDIDKTASIPVGEVELPPDWKERISRPTRNPVKVTEKEKKILDALKSPIPVDFKNSRFEDVLEYLRKKAGVPILVDEQTLKAVGASYDSPISMRSQEVSLRTVLRKVLGELNLAYVVKDEAIQVLTQQEAKEMVTIRTYQVADLVTLVDLRFGPVINQLQVLENVRQLMNLIVQTVAPETWEVNGKGGVGTISFYGPTMSLVVKQTAEVHYTLGGAFK